MADLLLAHAACDVDVPRARPARKRIYQLLQFLHRACALFSP